MLAQPTPLQSSAAAESKEEEEEEDIRRLLGSKLPAPTLVDLYLTGLTAGFRDTHALIDAM